MIPNKEIKRIYTTIFEGWFQDQVREIRTDFTEALRRKDVNLANELLNTILFESISYFDYDEKFYHGCWLDCLATIRFFPIRNPGWEG